MAALINQEFSSKGIKIELGKSVISFSKGRGNRIKCMLSDQTSIVTYLVIFAIGVKPETRLAYQAKLELGVTQAIKVNEYCQTSDPKIYAVGDVIEHNFFQLNIPGYVPLAGPANRQGRLVADHICGRKIAYRSTQRTAICKAFDLTMACVGYNELILKQANVQYYSAIFHATDHATYYPNANLITMKINFGKDGQIYGFQACGKSGVDKRVDIISVAQRGGLTVFDLQDLELCYAPPFNTAKDPVNIAGQIASNILNGDLKLCQLQEIANPQSNQFILDVRDVEECQKHGIIPGSVNIPLDQLRNRIQELPNNKEILIYCQNGARSWKGFRILTNLGYNTKLWNGGFLTYKVLTAYMLPF